MSSDQSWIQRKSAQDDRLLSANDVINLIFKWRPDISKGCIESYPHKRNQVSKIEIVNYSRNMACLPQDL